MKTLILPILLFAASLINAQNMTCCSKPASTGGMKAMANDPEFISAHEAPLPFNYTDQDGKMISFAVSDGKLGWAYEVKATTPTKNYLIITHEWWGLNDYIKERADHLQRMLKNVNVIAIDMFDGKVTSNPDTAGLLIKNADNTRIMNILMGAIAFCGKDAKIFSLGWCFGGGYALQTVIAAGAQGGGCVMYYGMPETDIIKLKLLNCDVLGLFALKDKWITPDVVQKFQENMRNNGKNLTVKSFDADHAFANPSNPNYNKNAAAEANQLAVEFLSGLLK